MTVKEVIKITATMIGREDVVDYLDGVKDGDLTETEKTVEIMVRLVNLVINELACSFIPMKTIEQTLNSGGKVYYRTLKYNPLEIKGVFNSAGEKVGFSVEHTFVKIDIPNALIEYSYFPPKYSLDDEIGYSEKDVSARVLAYGLSAEYAITQGCFKDAVMWHKRYADGVALLCEPKNSRIKERVWK
jgi:hypothetical protein